MERDKGIEATLEHLEALSSDDSKLWIDERTVKEYQLFVPSPCPRGDREMVIITQHEDERSFFQFSELTLGPANTRRLVDFLASLPDEPEEEDD